MIQRYAHALAGACLLASHLFAAPVQADLFEVASEINESIYSCDWLYRDVHEWAREGGEPQALLAGEKAVEVATIEASLKSVDLDLEAAEEEATPAGFAATSAFAAVLHSVCRAALTPGNAMDRYAVTMERELGRARSVRGDVEIALGRSLTSAPTTDPEVYAKKKAAWEAHLKEKEETERLLQDARQAAIDQWQKERKAQQRVLDDRSASREKEMLEASEMQAQEDAARAEEQAGELKKEMHGWYDDYKPRVAGVKRSLGQVLNAMKENDSGALVQSCSQLQLDLRGLDTRSKTLKSPDAEANTHLRDAYMHMRGLAVNCIQGRMATMQKELDTVKDSLGKAAKALAVYELRP